MGETIITLLVFWVFIKEAIQCSEIRLAPWHKTRQTVDFSAHRLNFIVICCTFLKRQIGLMSIERRSLSDYHICTATVVG
mgnify:CR=1 FL=1